ncbi:hypothetical protein NDK50_15170 [Paraburkholderia bryophila]|uniref:hypothetical protein n=1 Tax=Paraburkholderia bryophila TaxID=420952 RepID=UPI00234A6446|nr:hypothetical protein [Paraburkholderia bryophila]WCM18770.1 hypothetical protein NDK50_15170 [Paraburkholderia bryophila]
MLDRARLKHCGLGRVRRIVGRKTARNTVDRENEVVTGMPKLEPFVLTRQRNRFEPVFLATEARAPAGVSIVEFALEISRSRKMLGDQNICDDFETVGTKGGNTSGSGRVISESL